MVLRYSIKNNNVQPELKISFPTAHYAVRHINLFYKL